jgi:hypothetical protein
MGMDPATLGMASLGMQGAGTLMNAAGAYGQAKTQQGVLNYESQVAGNNAVYAGYQAQVAKQVGEQQVQTLEMQNSQLYSNQRATMAANGVDLGSGSATDILASTKYMGARDALTIQDNTNRRVWGLNTEAQNYESEANVDQSMRNSISPGKAAFGSLLGGAGSVASSWYRMSKAGTGN